MKIAIVILNWNGKSLLENYLPSVVQHSNEKGDIYVIDNASTDDSISFLQSSFPAIKIIKNNANLGFAGGYNEGLKQIDADVYCLLNSDVEVTKGWLDPIITTFNSKSDIAIIQPKILNHKRKDQFDYAGAGGGFIDKYGFPYCRGRIFNTIEEDKGQYNNVKTIFWASGACFFIRSAVFKNLNGFDDNFFAHMEEIDLCWRAFNTNQKIVYNGHSTVYHVGGATLNKVNSKKTYLNFRNSLFMLVKNLPQKSFIGILITKLFLDGIAGIHFLIQLKPKHTLAVIKAHFSFYVNLSRLLKQRKTLIQRPNYYQKKSIVWSYFVNKKRTFNSL